MFGGLIHWGLSVSAMALVLWLLPGWAWFLGGCIAAMWPIREMAQRNLKGKPLLTGWSANNHIEAWPPGVTASVMVWTGLGWWMLPAGVTIAAAFLAVETRLAPTVGWRETIGVGFASAGFAIFGAMAASLAWLAYFIIF